MARMAALAAAAVVATAAAMLLAGCVPTKPVPAALSGDGGLDQVRADQLDAQWSNMGLPADQRPPDTGYEVVAVGDWARKVAGCMATAGYENFEAVGGTLQIGKSDPRSEQVSESIDFFECRAAFQRDVELPSVMTTEQRYFLYDYYRETLVPCLELAGVEVEAAPTRDQFAQNTDGVAWNPYYVMDAVSFGSRAIDPALLRQCPSFPKGEVFDPWRIERDA